MEQLPSWAILSLISLLGGAILIIGYFLKRRDEQIESIEKDRKLADVLIENKLDKVLDTVNSMNVQIIKMETNLENMSKGVEHNRTKLEALEKWQSKTGQEVATLMEWKRNAEKL